MKHCATLIVAALILSVPLTVSAQGGGASSTGSISGQVLDDGGGALPGVTVTATSPAQIGMLTAVTNEEGIYRFPAVAPGEYKLEFVLSGFRTLIREGIRVTLGLNAAVAVSLSVANVQETVTVSGESPVVDPSTTRLQTNYDRETLASLPNARDMWSLLGATPSIALAQGRCRRQHGRHADELFRVRILRPEPSAHRRDQHDRGNLSGRFLSRLRLVRGSVHRRRRQFRRDAESRCSDAIRRSKRRRPIVSQSVLRLRERQHPEPEPSRRRRPFPLPAQRFVLMETDWPATRT